MSNELTNKLRLFVNSLPARYYFSPKETNGYVVARWHIY